MEDFSMYNIPYAQIDWLSIQPTFFQKGNPTTNQLSNKVVASAIVSTENMNYENTRPVSAYAMFFRERQIVAKKSFPQATFGDISRIVAAEWESLGRTEKSAYKRRTDQMRKMHIKMAAKDRVQRICSSMESKEELSEKKRKRAAEPLATRQFLENQSL